MVSQVPAPSSNKEQLREALSLACQAQRFDRISEGRHLLLGLPREWVLTRLAPVAAEMLDLADAWEYRRLLEAVQPLSPQLLQQLVRQGLESPDPEVREAAEDFRG